MTKARFAVAAALTLGAVTVPGFLLTATAATASPARTASRAHTASPARTASPAHTATPAHAAARAQGDNSQVSVAITGLTPRWATQKTTITVSGTVTNVSKESITDLSVQLDAASSPFGSASILGDYLAHPYQLGGNPVTQQQPISSALKPGHSAHWTIRFRAKAAGLTTFGVYALTAQVDADVGVLGPTLNYAYTFLPYLPAKHTRFAKTVPHRKQIAWVWPMIDYPLVTLPGRRVCSGSQVNALRASLSPGGRLASLLAAGSQYTGPDQLTWAVDPALLEDVRSLSHCEHAPGTARIAGQWLSSFRADTKTQPMFATPYADVELSLIGQRHSPDVQRAFVLGRHLAGQILDRSLGTTGSSLQITNAMWPPSGTADSSTLATLAAKENVQTLLLNSDLLDSGPGNVFQTNTDGGTVRVLLYSGALTSALGTAGAGPGSGFAAAQDYLAETALLAQSSTPGAIIVAPPRRWDPPAGLAAAALADTAQAPWLAPVPLASLERHVTSKLTLPSDSKNAERFSRKVVRQFAIADGLINQVSAIQVSDQQFYQASTALESSAWRGLSRAAQLAQVTPLIKYMRVQQQGVSVRVTSRVILGGLKGTVPVLVDNRLDYPVKVRVALNFKQPPGGGLKVVPRLSGAVTVPANGQEPVRIRVEASQVGATLLTVRLLKPQLTSAACVTKASGACVVAYVTVQATQFGNVAMIILASVLGLFVIASAIRGARRRDVPPPGDSGEPGEPDPDAAHGSQNQPETDTVLPERSELGTAGTSGL